MDLDYFKQRRAYRNFKLYEANISNGQNNLYRELLDYANDEGKLDVQFRMKNSALLSLTGLSEPGLDKARNSLVQLNLIKYVKGRKNVRAPEYKIINLYSRSASYPTSNPTSSEKSKTANLDKVGQPVGQLGGQPVEHKDLTSTDLDFTDTDSVDDDANGVTRANVLDTWTNLWGFPNAIARPELDEWLNAFAPDMVLFAIQIAGEHDVQPYGALKYLRAVISGWRNRKITTLKEAKKASADHDRRAAARKKVNRSSKPHRTEKKPGWMREGSSQTQYKATSATKLTESQQRELAERIAKYEEA